MNLKILMPVIAIAAGACLAGSKSYSDPKSPAIHSVCVMPPEARVMRVGMKGGESLTAESNEWARKLAAAFAHEVALAGGEIKGDLPADAASYTEEQRQGVVRIRQKYESVAAQLRRRNRDVRKARFTLTDEISLLPCAAQADSVAFIDATGTIQTGGRKTLSVITGGFAGPLLAMSHFEIRIAFADARTGEITTLLRLNSLGGKAAKDPDAVWKNALAKEFKERRIGPAPAAPAVAAPSN